MSEGENENVRVERIEITVGQGWEQVLEWRIGYEQGLGFVC